MGNRPFRFGGRPPLPPRFRLSAGLCCLFFGILLLLLCAPSWLVGLCIGACLIVCGVRLLVCR